MGCESPDVDFALIGHPESWVQVRRMMDALRRPDRTELRDEDVRDIYGSIPPRTVERLTITSAFDDRRARGVYVDTFIPPDGLDPSRVWENIERVHGAIACAAREGARIASLGGFTSIVWERALRRLRVGNDIALTTGNSLTAGFIVRGVERAAGRLGICLDRASILILGATGDLGTACSSYFATRARRLLLCARRIGPLSHRANRLSASGVDIHFSTDATELLPMADVVITVASLATPSFDPRLCRHGALVCDAGYPKNVSADSMPSSIHVFWGGMGRALGGWANDSPVGDSFYRFPERGIAHGCMLEGMVLGLERRYEPFSRGRGNITEDRMEEILVIAERHGIVLAPLFNARGVWPDEAVAA